MRLPILLLPLLSFTLSWIATFVIKRLAPRLNFVDKPGHRKIHHLPKTLGGGVPIFTALDRRLGLGPIPSIAITVLWIGMITNAFNFLDNMDGLSAGIAAVCATAFLIAALSINQYFVAGMLAMLVGSLLGFLCFN